jgi:hypothetical protein
LTHPTKVEINKGHRRVQVLGNVIFDFDARGKVHAWSWIFNELDLPALEQLPDRTVVAVGVPYQERWMNGYCEGILRSLQARHPGQAKLRHDYVTWAANALIQICWTEEVQTRVRDQIARVLALDAEVMAIADRIQLIVTSRTPLRLEQYNHFLQYQAHYRDLAQEAPEFIPLYALLSDEMHPTLEATLSIKNYLQGNSVGNAAWRLLSRVGTQWILQYLPYFDLNRQSRATCAVEIIQMATAFGTQALPPEELLHALIQLGGNPNSPSANFVDRLSDLFNLCERLGVLAQNADSSTLELLKVHAMAIFQWATVHANKVPTAVIRRITLKGILRKVQTQAMLDQKSHELGESWAVPYEILFDDPKLIAVVLDSELAVWQEGQLMRHCADDFVDRCATGELLMVSLRDSSQRHPLATVSFQMDRNWVLVHKFSGFANQRISDGTYELIQDCLRQLQNQRQSDAQKRPSDSLLMAA